MTTPPTQSERGPIDIIAEAWPIRPGCTCPEANDGPRPASCRCDERAERYTRERATALLDNLEAAGFQVLSAKQIDAIHSDGFRQGFTDV